MKTRGQIQTPEQAGQTAGGRNHYGKTVIWQDDTVGNLAKRERNPYRVFHRKGRSDFFCLRQKYCPLYGAFQWEKAEHRNACGECHAVRDEKTIRSGRLNEYLASVDEQAEDMFSRLVKEYDDRQGVTS